MSVGQWKYRCASGQNGIYFQQIFKRQVTRTTHSSWQRKLDRCFMQKIPATLDGQWFCKGEQFLAITILMVQQLMSMICLLSLKTCLRLMMNNNRMMYMQIILIMMRVYGRTFLRNCVSITIYVLCNCVLFVKHKFLSYFFNFDHLRITLQSSDLI